MLRPRGAACRPASRTSRCSWRWVLAFATGVGAVATGSPRGRGSSWPTALWPRSSSCWRRRRAGSSEQVCGGPVSAGLASLTLAVLTVAAVVAGSLQHRPRVSVRACPCCGSTSRWRWRSCRSRSGTPSPGGSGRDAPTSPGGPRCAWAGWSPAAAGLDAALTLGTDAARCRAPGVASPGPTDRLAARDHLARGTRCPAVDERAWRLQVVDGDGRYKLRLGELAGRGRACACVVLDCTSGWYSAQEWKGVPVPALIRSRGDARSLLVHSVTGYWVRFPVADVDGLLLATAVGGTPLAVGNGFPRAWSPPGGGATGGSSGSTGSSCRRTVVVAATVPGHVAGLT